MQPKKIFISLILLLTYSLGFAHNFVPHHHVAETEHHIENHDHEGHHHHHHHSTSKQLNTSHEHISHGNHFDEGFYDLLVCFLHKAHQDDECTQHYAPAKTNRISYNKFQVNKLAVTLFSITAKPTINELLSDCQIDSEIDYASPSIEDSPLRGPPSIS